jgi:tol-pal system protein YbgF
MLRALARLAPVAFLATGACVATRNDVRILQQDLAVMRAEAAQRDSARARRLEDLLASLTRGNDSLAAISTRLVRFQGDALGGNVKVMEQLIQIQALTGQSQQVIRQLRADLEQRAEEQAAQQATLQASPAPQVPAPAGSPTGTPAPTDSARPPVAPPAGPGPALLYEQATAQLRRGSTGAARDGFQELLARHPQSDLAADAQFYIGEILSTERKTVAADSVYRLVATRWPNAPRTATALYRLGLSLERQGNKADARSAFDEVVRRFPRSDEAELVRDRLAAPRD